MQNPRNLPEPHGHFPTAPLRAGMVLDVVTGLGDGLVIPFALVAGLSAVVKSTELILVIGLAQVAAGSIVMGLGNFFSRSTASRATSPLLERLGLEPDIQHQASRETAMEQQRWQEFLNEYDLVTETQEGISPRAGALVTAFAYGAGGLVPVLPYLFFSPALVALKGSVCGTLLCLLIFGYYRNRFSGLSPLRGALKTAFTGMGIATVAYCVALVFK